MGCGSLLGDLFYMADSLLEKPRVQPLHPIEYRGGNEGLHAQLYRMYGEGVIGEDVFNALRVVADRGELRPADLAVHRVKVSHRPISPTDRETQNALIGIQSRLAQLERTRGDSQKVLVDLETRLANLDKGAAIKEQKARLAVGENDEDTARQRLTEKADLASSHSRLAAQAEALREDLARLDHLRTRLETKAAELEAVRAREDLAKINGM